MSFSFNATAGASQNSSKPRLEGNNIHDVKFAGCDIQDIQGVKDPSQVYKVLKLRFENENGYFEHTVFEPRPEDFSRGENEITTKTGKKEKIPQTSGVENMMLLFKHAIDAINPTIAQQIDNGTKSLGAANWEELRKLVAKILDAGKGVSTQIKLLNNSKGEPIFPGYFAGLTKPDPVTGESRAYIRNNFIGGKLAFSAYEKTRITNEANAKPTKVNSFSASTNPFDLGEVAAPGNDLAFDIPDL